MNNKIIFFIITIFASLSDYAMSRSDNFEERLQKYLSKYRQYRAAEQICERRNIDIKYCDNVASVAHNKTLIFGCENNEERKRVIIIRMNENNTLDESFGLAGCCGWLVCRNSETPIEFESLDLESAQEFTIHTKFTLSGFAKGEFAQRSVTYDINGKQALKEKIRFNDQEYSYEELFRQWGWER